MNFFKIFHAHLLRILVSLQEEGVLGDSASFEKITVELPRTQNADVATNAALVLKKSSSLSPKDLAEKIIEKLRAHASIKTLTSDGPGFINITFKDAFWHDILASILKEKDHYGHTPVGSGQTATVEYVSVNPTGPMHAGHGRVAVVGDTLANLLEMGGYNVVREYYINDAGGQADVLARSAYLRYCEALGHPITILEGMYPGEYLKPIGRGLADLYQDRFLHQDESVWLEAFRAYAVDAMMDLIKNDLRDLGIHHHIFSSENALCMTGAVEQMVSQLEEKDLVYRGVLTPPKGHLPEDWEERPQLLFRSTSFGDDIDRPLQKSDGSWTYFAKDIAYHFDKYKRQKGSLYNIWGADHGGYVKRLAAATGVFMEPDHNLHTTLCQLVTLLDDGVPIKMSKRSGNFVTLGSVIEHVGKDVFRLMMLMRKNDAPLEFDFVKALDQSSDNPVFYIQYAHARIQSVKRQASLCFPELALKEAFDFKSSFSSLTHEDELTLIKKLASYPRQIEVAINALEPHRIAFYLHECAALLHSLWNKGKEDATLRFIHPHSLDLTVDKLALLDATALVLRSGLTIMGVTPANEMRASHEPV